jgi:predicted nucleic acid-binding protein
MTGFLLDTNIPSELTKPMPEPRVTAWVDAQDNASLYLSVVSVGELRRGFTALAQSKRRAQL